MKSKQRLGCMALTYLTNSNGAQGHVRAMESRLRHPEDDQDERDDEGTTHGPESGPETAVLNNLTA
jgi:hypothetical protein